MARQLSDRSRLRSPRRPRLPAVGRPRRLSPDEVAAIRARPWPRLPWWLWLAVVLTTVTMVVVGVGIFGPGRNANVKNAALTTRLFTIGANIGTANRRCAFSRPVATAPSP